MTPAEKTLAEEIHDTFKHFTPDYYVDGNPVWIMGSTEVDHWPELDLSKYNRLTCDGEKPQLYLVDE